MGGFARGAGALSRSQVEAEIAGRLPYFDQRDYYTAADAGDYSPAVARAIAAVAASGGRGEVILKPAAEAYRSAVDVPSFVTIRGGGSATEIVQDAAVSAGRIFRALGTVGTKTALATSALAGASTVALPSGAGASWSPGDFLELESTTIVYGSTGRARDVRRVSKVSGDTLTIEGVLPHDFLTGASATFAKVSPVVGPTIRDLRMANTDPNQTAYAIHLKYAADARIVDVSLDDMGGGILLHDVYGGEVRGVEIDHLRNGWEINPGFTGNGYGVALIGATHDVVVSGLRSRHVRHAITTLSDQRGSEYWGGPRDCLVVGSTSHQGIDVGGGTSHFDTHEFGTNIEFRACVATGGGANGFQVRAKNVSVVGCKAWRPGTRGVSITSLATGCHLDGGEFGYAGEAGVVDAGTGSRITGAWVHHSQLAGISLSGTDPSVEGCRVEANGQGGVSTYGIQDAGATRPRILGNLIPFATGKQTIAILNLGATGVATGNVCLGYGTAALFFGANAAARIQRNTTDTMGLAAKSSAYTVVPEDVTVLADAFGAGFTVTLPAASADNRGRVVTVKKTDSSANVVTISPNIDAASKTLTAQHRSITATSDGTIWRAVADF